MTDKTALVTGASGFIGNRLCQHLHNKGYKVQAMLRKMIKGPWDEAIVVDLVSDLPHATAMNVDTVYHLAGIAHDFRTGSDIDHSYRKVNTEATAKLASLAAANGVKRFVFVSSVKAGGASSGGACADEETQGPPEGI